jgi:hypothetical protein
MRKAWRRCRFEKSESVTIRCLHDNSLANATDVKMKSGELSLQMSERLLPWQAYNA